MSGENWVKTKTPVPIQQGCGEGLVGEKTPKTVLFQTEIASSSSLFQKHPPRILPRMFKEKVVQKDVLNTFIFGAVREGGLCVLFNV